MVKLYAGPLSNYTAAAASSSSAQSLVAGSSGNFSQPSIPLGFLEEGTIGQVITGQLAGVLSGQASATTAVLTIGLSSAPNTIAGGVTLLTTPAFTVTSFA